MVSSRPTERYAFLFKEGNNQYLFVKNIGLGVDSQAQLVLNARSGELLVRKVRVPRISTREKERGNPERDILQAAHAAADEQDFRPYIVRLYSATDVRGRQNLPTDPVKWSRITYMKFYNGGNLMEFLEGCIERYLTVPRRLILRFLCQVAHSLYFLHNFDYRAPICHKDLNAGNFFLHWEAGARVPDFYIGDFGASSRSREEATQPEGWKNDAEQLLHRTTGLKDCPHGAHADSAVFSQIIEKLRRIADQPDLDSPPDWPGLLALVMAADPSANEPANSARVPDFHHFRFRGQPSSSRPVYCNTVEECLQARGIHGPWYVAKVRVDPSRPVPQILQVGGTWHHRPNTCSNDSDTDLQEWGPEL